MWAAGVTVLFIALASCLTSGARATSVKPLAICSSVAATRLELAIDAAFARVALDFASDYPYAPVNRIGVHIYDHVLTFTDPGVQGRSYAGGNLDTFRFQVGGSRRQYADIVLSDRFDEKTKVSTATLRGILTIGGVECAVRYGYTAPPS